MPLCKRSGTCSTKWRGDWRKLKGGFASIGRAEQRDGPEPLNRVSKIVPRVSNARPGHPYRYAAKTFASPWRALLEGTDGWMRWT
jgi:hypothetical protein